MATAKETTAQAQLSKITNWSAASVSTALITLTLSLITLTFLHAVKILLKSSNLVVRFSAYLFTRKLLPPFITSKKNQCLQLPILQIINRLNALQRLNATLKNLSKVRAVNGAVYPLRLWNISRRDFCTMFISLPLKKNCPLSSFPTIWAASTSVPLPANFTRIIPLWLLLLFLCRTQIILTLSLPKGKLTPQVSFKLFVIKLILVG